MHKGVFWLAVGWTAFLAILCLSSLQSLPEVKIEFWGADKIVHFILHLVFTALWGLHFRNSHVIKPALKALLLSLFYGIVIEVLQHLLTNSRQADFSDVAANFAGAAVGALLLRRRIR